MLGSGRRAEALASPHVVVSVHVHHAELRIELAAMLGELGSNTATDLSALGSSILDGCHVIEVSAPIEAVVGETYGPYLVEELTLSEDLPSGTYTFSTESGDDGSVTLFRDGEAYDTLDYEWQATVGGGVNYTFDFGGLLILTVTRGMGTSNLFAMADSLFNGRHQVLVP